MYESQERRGKRDGASEEKLKERRYISITSRVYSGLCLLRARVLGVEEEEN